MNRLVLTNANLLDGNSPAVAKSTVIIDGTRIASVATGPPLAEDGDRVIDLAGRTVMPGMATCHFHSTYAGKMKKSRSFTPFGLDFPPAYQALIAHRNLSSALEQGYTVVVGAGSACEIDPGIKQAIEEGFVPGPRFTTSGRELSTTGHAQDLRTPWYWRLPSLGAATNCDGPDQFQIRHSRTGQDGRRGDQTVRHAWSSRPGKKLPDGNDARRVVGCHRDRPFA